MLDKLASWVEPDYKIVVVGDPYYANKKSIGYQNKRARVVVTRLRSDAHLRKIPPEYRPKGKRGRPPIYGTRIRLPRRARSIDKFEPQVEVNLYGKTHRVRLRKLVCLWHGLKEPVSVVIVIGIGKKPFYLLNTNPEAKALETLQIYAPRHALEQPYEDLKCDGGLGKYRGRTEKGVRRFALLCVTSHTLLRLIELIPDLRVSLPKLEEPWRKQLEHITVGQIRQGMARLLLDEYIRTGNFFNVLEKDTNVLNYQRANADLANAA